MTSNQTKPDFNYEILPDDYIRYDLTFKIIIIGDSGVGKSSITKKGTKNIFEESYNATIGFEFFTFNININDKIIRLQIWDTCGQELYRSLISNYYRNSSLAIIVYAVNSTDSFENIEMWLRQIRKNSSPDTKVFLIANKIDLTSERKISKKEGESFAQQNNLTYFMETSAKKGINCENMFVEIAKILYDDYLRHKNEDDMSSDASSQRLSTKKMKSKTKDNYKNKKGGCC